MKAYASYYSGAAHVIRQIHIQLLKILNATTLRCYLDTMLSLFHSRGLTSSFFNSLVMMKGDRSGCFQSKCIPPFGRC